LRTEDGDAKGRATAVASGKSHFGSNAGGDTET